MHKHLRLHFQKRTLDQIHECYRQDGPLTNKFKYESPVTLIFRKFNLL